MTLHTVALAIALAAWTALPSPRALHAQATPACLVRGEPARRLELADGRIVSVDVKSVAQSGGVVMAAGDFGYVFPRDAHDRTPPTMQDSIIGVVIDTRDRVAVVRSPVLPLKVHHPRVAPGPDGSFHVIFTASPDTALELPGATDTTEIWYARYGSGGWSAPRRVGRVAGVRMSQDHAHELLVRDGELIFAAPFIDARSPSSPGGIVVFRSASARSVWRTDTLRTAAVPGAVRIALLERHLQLLFTVAGRADELWLARFDSTWSQRRLLTGEARRSIRSLSQVITRRGTLVSWVTQQWFDDRTARLEWLAVDTVGRVASRPTIASGASAAPSRMILLDGEVPAWFYHARAFDSGLTVVTAAGDVLQRHAEVPAPFSNPLPAIAEIGRHRFLVFTMKAARATTEPMIASFATALEVRCPHPG